MTVTQSPNLVEVHLEEFEVGCIYVDDYLVAVMRSNGKLHVAVNRDGKHLEREDKRRSSERAAFDMLFSTGYEL